MTSYNEDEIEWALEQASLMRRGAVNSLDLENLAEELESMVNLQRNAVSSQIERLMTHLLKWQFQPEKRGSSWKNSIRDSRRQISRATIGKRGSTVIYNELPEYVEDEWSSAVAWAAEEMGKEKTDLSKKCPWALEELLNPDFYPRSLEEECDNPPSIKDALTAFEKLKGEQ